MPRGVGPWPRGRAASEIRTGQWIKRYLETHGEACIADLHAALRGEIREMNEDRKQQGVPLYRAPTYENFGKYFRNLVALGLIEFTGREAPIEIVFGKKPLLSIRQTDSTAEVVPSMRRFYRLTTAGTAEPPEGRWGNPIKYSEEMRF